MKNNASLGSYIDNFTPNEILEKNFQKYNRFFQSD